MYQDISLLPGMHSVMLGPMGNESCGMSEVEHWTTAPDIAMLAIATAVLDKVVTGPAISVIFLNANRLQDCTETGEIC